MRVSAEIAAKMTGWIRVSVPARNQDADVRWTEVYAKGFWRVDLGRMQPNKAEGRKYVILTNRFYFFEESDAMAFRLRWV